MNADLEKELIDLLLDTCAKEEERCEAAMELEKYPEPLVVKALLKIVQNVEESEDLVSDAAESLAKILIQRNELNPELIKKVCPLAQYIFKGVFNSHKPEWLIYFNFKT